ncbi:MAG: tyrosine-type recombinase/integrase [Bacteroidales bacterium]|nr:tyrosine-type recombinase/integrase [Bacteroidales bacterium]
MSLSHCIRIFFSYYLPEIKGTSTRTVQNYKQAFKIFLPFAADFLTLKARSIALPDISTELILSFLDHLEDDRKNSRATRNLRLCALKSLAKMIRLLHPDHRDIADRILNIPQKRKGKPLFGYLTQDELMTVFDAVDLRKKCGARDQTLLHLLFDSGARASEIADLEVSNIDVGAKSIGILGKGGRYRLVQLWPRTLQLIEHYIEQHRGSPKPPFAKYLFLNQRGEKLTRHGIHRLCVKYLKQSLPENRLRLVRGAHCFRHSCAVHMLTRDKPISDIKNHLGHEDINSTMIYLQLDLSRRKNVQEDFIRYTQVVLKNDPEIDDLIDWSNKEDVIDWLDKL